MRLIRWITLVILLTPAISMAKPFHVVIDAGHGGTDSGAMYDRFREADITLKVALYLEKVLAKDKSIKATMTRRSNKTVSLWTRSDLANKIGADLFVSIHVNSNPSGRARGAEFYFQSELPPDEEAMFLANRENHYHLIKPKTEDKEEKKSDVLAIVDDLKRRAALKKSYEFAKELRGVWSDHFRMRRRPIRQAPFHVLSEVSMPSVLVELGFITNRSEALWLSRSSNQKKLADLIYKGLKSYQERMDKLKKQGHIKAYAQR